MRAWIIRTAVASVVLVSCLVTGNSSPARGSIPVIDVPADADRAVSAQRVAFAPPVLTGPINRIALLGDSLFFEELPPVVRVNSIVPFIRTELRTQLANPAIEVRNLARPGLAIKYPLRTGRFQFISLSEWIPQVFNDPATYPDLVVIAATGIDLNIKKTTPVDDIVPELVEEMRRVVEQLRRLGMQVVVVPAFGVNDTMYDFLKSVSKGFEVRCETNARVNALNTALSLSDVPMLYAGYRDTDLDFDGDVDEANFVGFSPGRFPDDGIHTNATGERLIASQIAGALVDAIRGSGG
jgi:lysophospholipase L1-like esterase